MQIPNVGRRVYYAYVAAVVGLTIAFPAVHRQTGSLFLFFWLVLLGWMMGVVRESISARSSTCERALVRGTLYVVPILFCAWPLVLEVAVRSRLWGAYFAVVYMVVSQAGILFYLAVVDRQRTPFTRRAAPRDATRCDRTNGAGDTPYQL